MDLIKIYPNGNKVLVSYPKEHAELLLEAFPDRFELPSEEGEENSEENGEENGEKKKKGRPRKMT